MNRVADSCKQLALGAVSELQIRDDTGTLLGIATALARENSSPSRKARTVRQPKCLVPTRNLQATTKRNEPQKEAK